MYEFPGEGRKAGVHVPPWNPLEGRPWSSVTPEVQKLEKQGEFFRFANCLAKGKLLSQLPMCLFLL